MSRLYRVKTIQGLKAKILSKRVIVSSACWIYQGYIDRNGYGIVVFQGERWKVHRLSLKLFKPEIFIETMQVNHSCNTKRCFNPDHLYCGSGADNQKDSVIAGTHVNASKTHCKNGHEFTSENTKFDSKGARLCKICYQADYTYRNTIKNIL